MRKRLEVLEREAAEKPKAEERQKSGKAPCEKFTQGREQTSSDKAAAAVGMSGPTYQRAGAMLADLPDFGRGKKSDTVSDLGIDWNQSRRWQLLASVRNVGSAS